MNSKQIGNITELETMLAFMKLGYNVLTPYGDCERYDFVVDVNGKFIRVQSKTSRTTDDGASFGFSGRSCNRKEGRIIHEQENRCSLRRDYAEARPGRWTNSYGARI